MVSLPNASIVQAPVPAKYVERFWSRVDRSGGPDSCWLWQKAIDRDGYGQAHTGGRYDHKNWKTHRLAWVLVNGDIPDGLSVLHDCDTRYQPGDFTYRRCCNPNHLHLGTHRENSAEMSRKGRAARAKQVVPHLYSVVSPYGMRSYKTALNRDSAQQVRERFIKGETLESLAEHFGVSCATIARAAHGARRRFVKPHYSSPGTPVTVGELKRILAGVDESLPLLISSGDESSPLVSVSSSVDGSIPTSVCLSRDALTD